MTTFLDPSKRKFHPATSSVAIYEYSPAVTTQSDLLWAFRETGGETRSVFGGVTLSGRVKSRRVCPDCGTWVYGDPRTRAQYSGMVRAVRAGTLDDTSWLRPTAHLFTRNAQPWIILPEGVNRYETQPHNAGR